MTLDNRCIEHNPIEFRAAGGYLHEVTCAGRLHNLSLGDGEADTGLTAAVPARLGSGGAQGVGESL